MVKNGFEPGFSAEVMSEVRSIVRSPPTVPCLQASATCALCSGRPVDNRESRDLDQIEVTERLADGSIRVRIGVADVEGLVPIGSPADQHAAVNTTSVYTGVAVFPMLPERLSTDLTSLNEGEDPVRRRHRVRRCHDGSIGRASVFNALVHNKAKLVYDDIGLWLENKGPAPKAIAASPELHDQLMMQDEAAQTASSRAQHRGSARFRERRGQPRRRQRQSRRSHRRPPQSRARPDRGFHDRGQQVGRNLFDRARLTLAAARGARAQTVGSHRGTGGGARRSASGKTRQRFP